MHTDACPLNTTNHCAIKSSVFMVLLAMQGSFLGDDDAVPLDVGVCVDGWEGVFVGVTELNLP